MSALNNVELSILLVDDSDYKIKEINKFIQEFFPNTNLTTVNDSISCQKLLKIKKYDLMLLDMQLPLRKGDCEINNGGVDILDELDMSEELIQPSTIIVFTQYEELQTNIRSKFPELGAIKFDISSTEWKSILKRAVKTLIKSRSSEKKIIYCEGNDVQFYSRIDLNNFSFYGVKDSRAVYHAAKNEKDCFSLRDRDFLTNKEIITLTNEPYFKNYFILEYYCLENYLLHPLNLAEAIEGFDVKAYTAELIRQKNEKLEAIIQDYKLSRMSYTDFTDNDKRNMDESPENTIILSLKSDDFETFYRFFDMAGKKDKTYKKSFNKLYLEKYSVNREELAKTNWFKSKITRIILDKNHYINKES